MPEYPDYLVELADTLRRKYADALAEPEPQNQYDNVSECEERERRTG